MASVECRLNPCVPDSALCGIFFDRHRPDSGTVSGVCDQRDRRLDLPGARAGFAANSESTIYGEPACSVTVKRLDFQLVIGG